MILANSGESLVYLSRFRFLMLIPQSISPAITRMVAIIVVALATFPASAAVVFEDSFDQSNSSGGSRALVNNSNISNGIVTTSPFSTASGSYLRSNPTNGSGTSNIVTYTPSSLASSWEAMAGSLTIGSNQYTTLNGGFDLFIRPQSTDTQNNRMDVHWFRPVDFTGNSQAFRFIFEGNAAGQLLIQLIGQNGQSIATADNPSTFNQTNHSLTYNNFFNQLTLGESYHLGFTFATDITSGKITLSIFGVTGTGAIDTTSTTQRLATNEFYINDTVARAGGESIFGGERSWTMSARDSSNNFQNNTSIEYDTVRMHTGTVTSFDALPVPEPARALLMLVGLSTMLWHRRRPC